MPWYRYHIFAQRVGLWRVAQGRVGKADNQRHLAGHGGEVACHDGAQHRLTALAYLLATSAKHARAASDQTAGLLERAEAEVTLAIDELRELAHGIHPSVLTDLGLADALRSIAARSTVKVHVVELPTARVEPTAEAAAYYVVAEAVTNAERYADASTIYIRVSADADSLRVEVDDDGVGGASMNGGSGLQGLSDRVDAVGGSFSLRTAPGQGTHIKAVIPARPGLTAQPRSE